MRVLTVLVLAYTPFAWACPACDFGGKEAAAFITVIFGLFIAGFATLFIKVWRGKGIAGANEIANQALIAEDILPQEKKNE